MLVSGHVVTCASSADNIARHRHRCIHPFRAGTDNCASRLSSTVNGPRLLRERTMRGSAIALDSPR